MKGGGTVVIGGGAGVGDLDGSGGFWCWTLGMTSGMVTGSVSWSSSTGMMCTLLWSSGVRVMLLVAWTILVDCMFALFACICPLYVAICCGGHFLSCFVVMLGNVLR